MDQPIIYEDYDDSEVPREEPLNFYAGLDDAVLFDDKDEFLRLIKDPEFEHLLEYFQADKIFEYDAIKIAIAVFNGETRGIIDLDNVLVDGWTPLHLAASMSAPKITNYLLQRGDHVHVDVPCDCEYLNLRHATPVELAVDMIETGYTLGFFGYDRPWTPRNSLFELLYFLCEDERTKGSLEAVRLLVKNTQNKDRIRKAFLVYAHKGKLVQLAALFLAAPELFLSSYSTSPGGGMSSIDMLYLLLNSSEKRTDIEDAFLKLLDVFTLVGYKLIAYIRVDGPKVLKFNYPNEYKIGILREVAHKKLGISSPDDYLLSFFKPVTQEVYQHISSHLPDHYVNCTSLDSPFSIMEEEDIDMDYVNSTFFSLNHEDAAVMNKAIEKKLSTMPNLRNLYEGMIRIPTTGEKQRCSFPSVRSFEPSVRFFSTKETNAKCSFDFKVTPTNGCESRVMQPTKLKSFFSAARLSHFPMIAKRLIK